MLEPMEVVQKYMNTYHHNLEQLNTLPPAIEPRASGHIIEQIELIKEIIAKGYAYEVNGSVYFDLLRYNEKYKYGKLSGRVLEDLQGNTRVLDGQDEKRSPFDFALWKKASPAHLMKWPSPWSTGFPGWHLECSAMSVKYLGEVFDIHGGGMDLLFPHHESEIAQSRIACGHDTVRYWMHNNMITINGQKMGKSLGNAIALEQFFNGEHPLLEKGYSPMTIRFFILQAHYRSTLDFSNEALQAAEKGMKRLLEAGKVLQRLQASDNTSAGIDIAAIEASCYEAMNDDFNSPITIANLFEAVRIINSVNDGKESLAAADLEKLATLYKTFVFDILGLSDEASGGNTGLVDGLMDLIISLRAQVRASKDFATSDKIRDELLKLGIQLKDGKDGATWNVGS